MAKYKNPQENETKPGNNEPVATNPSSRHDDNPENPISPAKDNKPAQTDNKPDSFFGSVPPMIEKIKPYIEILLAGLAVWTLCTINSQLSVMREQTDISRAQLVNQARAWVTIKKAYHEPFKEGEKAVVHIVFANSGNSPALNVTGQTEIELRSSEIPSPMPFRKTNGPKSKAVIGPQVFPGAVVFSESQLSNENVATISSGTKNIFVWGRLEYDDIFNRHHFTEFCMRSQPNIENFEACENNNNAN